jgi:hypothetical protein
MTLSIRIVLLIAVTFTKLAIRPYGFMAPLSHRRMRLALRDNWDGASNGSGGRIEQIEFKIFPDGEWNVFGEFGTSKAPLRQVKQQRYS